MAKCMIMKENKERREGNKEREKKRLTPEAAKVGLSGVQGPPPECSWDPLSTVQRSSSSGSDLRLSVGCLHTMVRRFWVPG